MKAKFLLSLLLLSTGFKGICTTWTITNSGMTFTPASITIILGDSVEFVIAAAHNAVEVSDTTWNANDNTPLPGGFQVPFGGGLLLPSQLIDGVHYYVCNPHAPNAMKGIIIVLHHAGIAENLWQTNFSVYPNPATTEFSVISYQLFEKGGVSIHNMLGEKIIQEEIAAGEKQIMFSINDIPGGIYFLSVKQNQGVITKRIVIQ